MDEKPQGAQVPEEKIQRLEEDLSSLKSEEEGGLPQATPQQVPEQPTPPMVPVTPTVTVTPSAQTTQPPQPEVPTKKSNKILWLGLGLLFLSIVLGGAYLIIGKGIFSGKKACTQEVKVCPDGTSVGRTGPNCEFGPCVTPPPLPTIEPTPEATSSATPTASPSGSPTASPSATPTATPAL